MRGLFLSCVVFGVVAACSFDPEYEPYSKIDKDSGTDDGSGTASGEESCEDDVTLRFSGVQTSIENTCGSSGCHGGGAGGLTLEAGEATDNEKALLAYTGSDANTLFDKISSDSHGGGDQSSSLALSTIESWVSARAACPSS